MAAHMHATDPLVDPLYMDVEGPPITKDLNQRLLSSSRRFAGRRAGGPGRIRRLKVNDFYSVGSANRPGLLNNLPQH